MLLLILNKTITSVAIYYFSKMSLGYQCNVCTQRLWRSITVVIEPCSTEATLSDEEDLRSTLEGCIETPASQVHILHSGLFYYNIRNVRPRHRSKLSSIRLLAITYRSHIKKYGMNAILQPIVDDVKKLVSYTCTYKYSIIAMFKC